MADTDVTTVQDTRPHMETERLIIRPTEARDADDFRRHIYSWDVCDMTLFHFPYEEGTAEAYLATHAQCFADRTKGVFSVELKSDPGHVIGIMIIRWNAEFEDIGEVGYALGRPFWGRGYATEATQRMVKYGFDELSFVIITGDLYARNPASGRVLEKVGMRYDGRLRMREKKWGKFEDMDHYSITLEEYTSREGTTTE